MINLNQAIEKAEEFRGGNVVSAGDCGDRWIFGFKEDVNMTGIAPVAVFKKNGECEFFCVSDYIIEGVFDNQISIDLIEQKKINGKENLP